jgi:hypothetical protein
VVNKHGVLVLERVEPAEDLDAAQANVAGIGETGAAGGDASVSVNFRPVQHADQRAGEHANQPEGSWTARAAHE